MERDLEKSYLSFFDPGQGAMAASRQVIEYTINFAREHGCQSIMDAGSGMSTLFFNAELEPQCRVVTLDDDPSWAKITVDIVSQVLKKDITIKGWMFGQVDITFYDYGSIESRIYHFRQTVEQTRRYMIIDDMHVSYYREYVQQVCVGKELRFLPETVDEYGRYAALLVL